MLFLIDGIAVEFEEKIGKAIRNWHESSDDKVLTNGSPEVTQIYTNDGNGRTIRSHFAKALAECDLANWQECVKELLGRPFNEKLDTICLSIADSESMIERRELKLTHTRNRDFWYHFYGNSTIDIRYDGILATRSINKRGNKYHLCNINASISLDIEMRVGPSSETYWNSRQVKIFLRRMREKVLVDEHFLEDNEHVSFLAMNNISIKSLKTLPQSKNWSNHIAREITGLVLDANREIIEIKASVTEGPYLRSVFHRRR